MSEEAKIAGAAAVGAVIGLRFMPQSVGAALFSIASSVTMALLIAKPLAEWLATPQDTVEMVLLVGLLVGLFGLPMCDLIFRALRKSDLSIKFTDILEFIMSRRG